MVYRKLGRTNAHRKALLRNLVSSLIEFESITTTHAKAKEAQSAAERLITLAKSGAPDSYTNAYAKVFKPEETLPKLFKELAPRYANKNGGYTRILKLEPRLGDNSPQSILELVGGKRDMRMAMTARVVAKLEMEGAKLDEVTTKNTEKCIAMVGEKYWREQVDLMKEIFYQNDGAEVSSSGAADSVLLDNAEGVRDQSAQKQ